MNKRRRDEWIEARRQSRGCGDVVVIVPPAPQGDAELSELLYQLNVRVEQMSEATDNLAAKVAEQGTVIASAVELINGIPALVADALRTALEQEDIEDAQVDEAVRRVTTDVESQTDALRQALVSGTGEQLPEGGQPPDGGGRTP